MVDVKSNAMLQERQVTRNEREVNTEGLWFVSAREPKKRGLLPLELLGPVGEEMRISIDVNETVEKIVLDRVFLSGA